MPAAGGVIKPRIKKSKLLQSCCCATGPHPEKAPEHTNGAGGEELSEPGPVPAAGKDLQDSSCLDIARCCPPGAGLSPAPPRSAPRGIPRSHDTRPAQHRALPFPGCIVCPVPERYLPNAWDLQGAGIG